MNQPRYDYPRPSRRRWTGAMIALLVAVPMGRQAESLVGRWRGRSICVKAAWNAACNDEIIVYDFESQGADSTRLLLHASKVVAGVIEPMGDLPLTFDTGTSAWQGDFANSRVSIRWIYRIVRDTLVGQVVIFPDQRIGRHVRATRDRTSP